MKKFLVLFSIILLFTNLVSAETITIKPEKLTSKITKNYNEINALTEKLYTNIETKIDVTKYPSEYNNFPLMSEIRVQNPNYYYVQSNKAELIFDKQTKKLKLISFKQSTNPKSWIVYSYPSGNLNAVEIWASDVENYIFAPSGEYVNFIKYSKALQKKIKSCFKVKNKSKFANSKVDLLLTINRNGELKNCKILHSSSIKEFDDEAVKAVLKASPFDSFPEAAPQDKIEVIFSFKINALLP